VTTKVTIARDAISNSRAEYDSLVAATRSLRSVATGDAHLGAGDRAAPAGPRPRASRRRKERASSWARRVRTSRPAASRGARSKACEPARSARSRSPGSTKSRERQRRCAPCPLTRFEATPPSLPSCPSSRPGIDRVDSRAWWRPSGHYVIITSACQALRPTARRTAAALSSRSHGASRSTRPICP